MGVAAVLAQQGRGVPEPAVGLVGPGQRPHAREERASHEVGGGEPGAQGVDDAVHLDLVDATASAARRASVPARSRPCCSCATEHDARAWSQRPPARVGSNTANVDATSVPGTSPSAEARPPT